jgi:hypothetical protein
MGHYGFRNSRNSKYYYNLCKNFENKINLQETNESLCLQLQEKDVEHENEIYHFEQIKENLCFQLQEQDVECNQLKAS